MYQTVFNAYSAKEHVAEIDSCIHTVKESSCAIVRTLSFQYLYKTIVTNIFYFAVLWINSYPVKNGVYTKNSPQEIMVHTNLIWKKHCKVFWGPTVSFTMNLTPVTQWLHANMRPLYWVLP